MSAPAEAADGGLLTRLRRAGAARLPVSARTATDAGLFLGGNVYYQGARFVVYLVAARLLGPDLYGLWNALLLLLTNSVMYGHLGVVNAMTREIPYNEGRGAGAENPEVASTGFTAAVLSALLIAAGTMAVSLIGSHDAATALGLRLVALLLVLEALHQFFDQLLRAYARFRTVALVQIVLGTLLLVGVTGLTIASGFEGFLWAHVAAFAVVVLVLRMRAPLVPTLRWNRARTVALARIGFPIMMAGFAYGMLTSLDRLMVLGFLGREQLGYYSLAFMAYGTMMLIPRSVSQMVYPRMAREFGRTKDPGALRDLVYRPLRWLAMIMVPVLAVALVAAPYFVRWFLPQYAPGIPALRITIVSVFFLSFMGGFGNFLTTVHRQKLYLSVIVGALVVNLGLNWAVLAAGLGITGVAAATLITQVAFVAALWLIVRRILAHGA